MLCFRSYDPKTNRWSKVSSMTTRRLGVAVAVLGGLLYAVGGSDGQSPLSSGGRRIKTPLPSSARPACQASLGFIAFRYFQCRELQPHIMHGMILYSVFYYTFNHK